MNGTVNRDIMPLPLLVNYQKDSRNLAILEFEYDHFSELTEAQHNEVISAMTFAHEDRLGVAAGRISDKTAFIALHYRAEADGMVEDPRRKLGEQIRAMMA